MSCNGPQAKLKLVLKRSNEEIFVVGGQGSVLIPAVEFEIENDQNIGIVSSDTKTLNRTNSRTNKTAGKTSSDSGKFRKILLLSFLTNLFQRSSQALNTSSRVTVQEDGYYHLKKSNGLKNFVQMQKMKLESSKIW